MRWSTAKIVTHDLGGVELGTLLSERFKEGYRAVLHLSRECMESQGEFESHPYNRIFRGFSLPSSTAIDADIEPFCRIAFDNGYPEFKLQMAWNGVIFSSDRGDEDEDWLNKPVEPPKVSEPAGPLVSV